MRIPTCIFLLLMGVKVCANPFLIDIAKPGMQAYQQKDYNKAVSEFIKAQDKEPLAVELAYNLGAAYYQQEEYEKAIGEFDKAIRADDPKVAAGAYYNRGNAKYRLARKEFEAASATTEQEKGGEVVKQYVSKLEECIKEYEETLKRTPEDADAKYNLEMIRREIKNLMRRDPQDQNQQQQQQQQQQQENQEQQNQDEQKQQQEQKQDQSQQSEQQQQEQKQNQDQGTPTPQPQISQAEATPTPAGDSQQDSSEQKEPTPGTTPVNMSQEMVRNLLENLPEQRPRLRSERRYRAEKDW